MTVHAPAKLNLSLQITHKTKDGYHELASWVAFINLYDRLTLTPIKHPSQTKPNITISLTGTYADALLNEAEESNHISKAINLFYRLYPACERPSWQVTLDKQIPVGAGLGGGSSDGYHCFKALCNHHQIEEKSHTEHLAKLGADYPLFAYAGQTNLLWMEGIGDKLTPIKTNLLDDLSVLIAYPVTPVSTRECFTYYDQQMEQSHKQPLENIFKPFSLANLVKNTNDLEQAAIALAPSINALLTHLRQDPHSLLARMTGSGSACFSLYETAEHANAMAVALKQNTPYHPFLTKFITL